MQGAFITHYRNYLKTVNNLQNKEDKWTKD